jgi:hypothetical protein
MILLRFFHLGSHSDLTLHLASYSDFRSWFVGFDEITPLARSARALNIDWLQVVGERSSAAAPGAVSASAAAAFHDGTR